MYPAGVCHKLSELPNPNVDNAALSFLDDGKQDKDSGVWMPMMKGGSLLLRKWVYSRNDTRHNDV